MSDTFKQLLQQHKQRVDNALSHSIGSFDSPYCATNSSTYLKRLEEATRYTLLIGGKRIRPTLVYCTADAINANNNKETLDQIACAIEMIHAYSLIHDDLPAMDNDDLRRGQPTCHRAFDEATAILTGDLLQARAFEILTELNDCPASTQLQLIKELTCACGQKGMVGGQAIDMFSVNQTIDLPHLETLHGLKTGALIRAAVSMGARYAGATNHQLQLLDNYAQAIGLAFQVQDDILDIEGDTHTLGKTQGADQAMNKPTYPMLLGLEQAKSKAEQLHQQALTALTEFDSKATPLRYLSAYIISRHH